MLIHSSYMFSVLFFRCQLDSICLCAKCCKVVLQQVGTRMVVQWILYSPVCDIDKWKGSAAWDPRLDHITRLMFAFVCSQQFKKQVHSNWAQIESVHHAVAAAAQAAHWSMDTANFNNKHALTIFVQCLTGPKFHVAAPPHPVTIETHAKHCMVEPIQFGFSRCVCVGRPVTESFLSGLANGPYQFGCLVCLLQCLASGSAN